MEVVDASGQDEVQGGKEETPGGHVQGSIQGGLLFVHDSSERGIREAGALDAWAGRRYALRATHSFWGDSGSCCSGSCCIAAQNLKFLKIGALQNDLRHAEEGSGEVRRTETVRASAATEALALCLEGNDEKGIVAEPLARSGDSLG
jgi:hypothetical protein